MIARTVEKLRRLQNVLILLACISLIISTIGIANAIGSTTDIGSQKIWLQPGGSKFDSITIEIGSEIFDKLPSISSGGFSLVAETEGKPQFIKHHVDDAKASKVSSGFVSKCQVDIYYTISVDNNTQEGTYVYDVVYNLQNGLLRISRNHVIEVSWEKPAWVVEKEKEEESWGSFLSSTGYILAASFTIAIFLVIPLFLLIRKIRRPQYERGKLGWKRAIVGIALFIIASYVMFDTIVRGILQESWLLHIVILNLILGVGIILIGIIVVKP